MTEFNKPRTICWDCANACGGCSWSDHWLHKPIEGWTALRNDLNTKEGETTESYIVFDCPEFVRDATGFGSQRLRRVDDEGCVPGLQISETEVG